MASINKTARLAGILYLLMAPLGIFGILYIPSTLFVPGDMAATASNILENQLLFRLSIVSAIVVQLVNIWVAILLYKLLKPVNQTHASLMVIFLLLGVPIAYLNELTYFAVLLLVNGGGPLASFTTDQMLAHMSLFLDLHKHGIMIAQVFWGLWLFPMGYLIFRSGYLPRILGILLMIGCFGYVIDSFIFFVNPDFGVTFSEFTFLGEILMPLWLVIKGVNVERWEQRALESA